MTYASVASMMLMDYPIGEGRSLGPAERMGLYDVLSGQNTVVASLEKAGYEYVHIEGGWGGSRCGVAVDDCLRTDWFEETSMALAARTPFGALIESAVGHSFSHTALSALDRLVEVADENRGPRFVFAHVLLPHPPLHVTAACEVRPKSDLRGLNVAAPWQPPEEQARRRAGYAAQVECVNARILEFVERVDRDAIVLIVSDHGPDSRGQLLKPTGLWNDQDISERMSTFAAIRIQNRCSLNAGDIGVNLFRTVFRCAFDADLPSLPQQHFLVNVEENHPTDVSRRVSVP